MTTVHVDILQVIGTSPNWPAPHVIGAVRTVKTVIDAGPCQWPQTIVNGDTKTVVACGKRRPAVRLCKACRTNIVPTVTGICYAGPHTLLIDGDGWLCELIKGYPENV